MEKESNPLWKLLGGVVFGVVLTWLYVRFGFELPGIARLGQKVAAEAVVTTAEVDLYDPAAPLENRQRALAMVISEKPELFLEIDESIGGRFFHEAMRRKAVRKAKLLKHRDKAYDMALEKPALREVYERKHGVRDRDRLKRAMFIADIRRDEFLYDFLTGQFPQASPNELAEIVQGVYQNELRPDRVAAATAETSDGPVSR